MAGLGRPTPNPRQGLRLTTGSSPCMLQLGEGQLEKGARGADTNCLALVDTEGPVLTCTDSAPRVCLSQCYMSCLGPGMCEGPGCREDEGA